MKIGKITGKQVFGEDRVFNGMDITAEYLDNKNRVSIVSFRYTFLTNNLRGMVEKVLNAFLSDREMPKDISLFVNMPGLR